MKVFGYGMVVFSSVFFLAAAWALHMFNVQGDPRWFLSIGFCPIFGLITASFGIMFVRMKE